MTDTNPGPATQVIDWLFSRFGAPAPEPLPGAIAPSTAVDPGLDYSRPQPPPVIHGPEDLQAACAWLDRERKRLEGYTQSQLAQLREAHQKLIQQNYTNEANLIFRSQELSGQEERLAAQSRALQRQAMELSQREQALAEQLKNWRKAQEELAVHQELHARTKLEVEAQTAILDTLQNETKALQASREATQTDLESLAVSLLEQKQAREKEQVLFAERMGQLETRLRAAEQAERAAQRRQAELEELEERLFRELEERERALENTSGADRGQGARPRPGR
jgi:chromosome segregation ATPase